MAGKGTIAVSENQCAHSVAVIADAQASIVRATESVQNASNTLEQLKKRRELVVRAKSQ